MFDYNVELAIKEAFLFEYVLADAVNAQDLFGLLCDIYCVDEQSRNEISELLQAERLVNMHTFDDYCREMRIKQYYNNFCGGYVVENEKVEQLVAIKGAVFEQAQNSKLFSGYDKSSSVAYDELVKLAFEGLVCAKRLLGVMQTEGIYITQDTRSGFENLQAAADWSDIQALVTMIYYNDTDRKYYLDKLFTVTEKNDYADIVEQLQMQYGIDSCNESNAVKMLEKAFAMGVIKRDICSSQHLRVLRSNVLSDKDKRTVLLSGSKEIVPIVCGLPLNLRCENIDPVVQVNAILNRFGEHEIVTRAIRNNRLRDREFYRCPCISSNSEFIREKYSDFICEAFGADRVVQIDVGFLMPIDFEAIENNVFIRSCVENSVNVFAIKLCGKIDERIVNLVKSFATGSVRKAYAISRLGISIDLSSVLPIFICDKRNAQLLDGVVNTISPIDVTEAEKPLALEDILHKKQAAFGMDSISFEEEAKEILLGLPIDKVGNVLDRAIMQQCQDGALQLSTEIVRSCIEKKETRDAYGFGGKNNARK